MSPESKNDEVEKYLNDKNKKLLKDIRDKGTDADVRFMAKYNLIMKELGRLV